MCQSILGRVGPAGMEAYNKLALVMLMQQFDDRCAARAITPRVRALFIRYFESIIGWLARPRKNYYRHQVDAFAKDFAVCRMKLWPCGAELVDECSGVPRKVVFGNGIGQTLSGLPFLMAKAGGFSPFFEIHADRRFISDFGRAGYDDLYLTIADLLRVNPDVKGLMGSSWWHDPALASISPDLWFLTEVPLEGGARLMRAGTNKTASRDAMRFSTRRTSLHENGDYNPQVYMFVWPRAELLKWAADKRS